MSKRKITTDIIQPIITRSIHKRTHVTSIHDNNISVLLNERLKQADDMPSLQGWNMGDALRHLCTVDTHLCRMIEQTHVPDILIQANSQMRTPYTALLQSIIYQQIAGSAAKAIYSRLCESLGVSVEDNISPSVVYNATFCQTEIDGKRKMLVNGKVSGLSGQKAKYIQSLTELFMDTNKLKDFDFHSASNDEVFEKLIEVKGVGAWSIHMFMIFHLNRPDVLPTGDLAVRRGVCKLYDLPLTTFEGGKRGENALKERCVHWSPYSTVGALYMWKMSSTTVMEREFDL
eukprot:CAMPEP_0185037436 /NCGR_PEP_ID=MMETSP1103-20130426/31839_1 /TAXON_ID=36769 /ORGANISM="Paraphysomonas bandaiensis, Strain Caron Lab Isolate" /LENGTH=287 /DNA_ID=CAMNT_0027575405 /DNA_START=1 /DNA_END=864 /DNA_ORIENTATION=+